MTTRTAGPMPRDHEDLIAGMARVTSAGLMLALPIAALVILRQFPPLTLEPTAASGWLVPGGTALLAAVAALSAVPALWWVIRSGRWAGATSGSGWLTLAATAAVIALNGPAVSTTFPGPVLAVGVVAASVGWLATAAVGRSRLHGPARWWAGGCSQPCRHPRTRRHRAARDRPTSSGPDPPSRP